jgi:hypothetical protein
MIELQRRFELEWQAATARNDKERIRRATGNGSFHVFTFCGSLRGFKNPKLLIHDLRQQTLSPEESAVDAILGNYVPTHISLPLRGRLKARSQEIQRRVIDICWETKSGLQPGFLARRLIKALEECGIEKVWAYKKRADSTQMKMSEFAESFFELLQEIQRDRPDLIAPEIDVIKDYGLSRSERHGATTRAQAVKVPQDVIDWVNRWNIGEEDVVHGPVRVVYLERKQMMETFLAFS